MWCINDKIRTEKTKRNEKKKYPKIVKSVPFIGCYLRMIMMLEEGCFDELLKDSKELFLPMAKKTGTLWEHSEAFASLNHGFASYAANIIIYSLIGIKEINEYNKNIVLKKRALPCDFEIKLPLFSGSIVFKSHNNTLDVDMPNDYKLLFED